MINESTASATVLLQAARALKDRDLEGDMQDI
jgi:hypothetical protein